MSEPLRADDESSLRAIRFELSGAFIELPAPAVYDKPTSVVLRGNLSHGPTETIRSFGPLRRIVIERPRVEVTVRGVLAVKVRDRADIGGFNLNGFDYDAARGLLRLEGGVPVEVDLAATGVDVTMEVLEGGAERVLRWTLRRPPPT